jgi:hypothetical protein
MWTNVSPCRPPDAEQPEAVLLPHGLLPGTRETRISHIDIQDDSIDMEADLKMTLSIWKMTLSM